jgi:hypothetical protein
VKTTTYFFYFLLLGTLLLHAPTVRAQTAQTSPFPRWYVGLQYGRQDYHLIFSATTTSNQVEPGRTNSRRPQLTAGYQVSPRLGLQLGLAPLWESFTFGSSGTNDAGEPVLEKGLSKGRSLAVPVLARYALAPNLWKHLQLEMLAGPVLFFSEGKSDFTRTENGVVTRHSVVTTQVRNAFLTAGPSARYEVGRHLAGFADWLFYKNLQSSSSSITGSNLGNKTGITTGVNLGIQYRFNYR